MHNILKNINAPIAEIGVSLGITFKKYFLKYSVPKGIMAYAYDSWKGMGEPTKFDGSSYPAGRFGMGGKTAWQEEYMKDYIEGKDYIAYEGFVPHNLFMTPANIKFYYVRIDLDHYLPTLVAAHWAWNRLIINGYLSSHDYFAGNTEGATRGMNIFFNDIHGQYKLLNHDETTSEIFIQKIS